MVPLSVLDLSPIIQGADARQALANSLDLARHAERLGYRRFWMAEHHNMPGVASAATAVCLAHVGQGTSTIRIGAGGIMLPNHAPLVIAEQFGTLEALFPGRVDLGLGRAPGTDQLTARALRRTLIGDVDRFPQDVVELMAYFQPLRPEQRVQAVPGAGLNVPVWILGSSTYGAQLAAALGLPYAFASHFAPAELEQAIAIYRQRFEPSEQLARPYVMLGLNVVAAETDAEAKRLFTSIQQAFLNLRTGRPGPLPPPVDDIEARFAAAGMTPGMQGALATAVVGGPETVRQGLAAFVEKHAPDEVIVTAQIYDHAARLRSFDILARAAGQLAQAA
ncbi:LLM class flavin-dependent oxidoreductase [Phenylobacterium sp.]|uniref:LLM class flavin-dependent oxidoreductase n=1 Tax=Phenylobacterium sp. TaxID=1871053 RepID=UPI002F940A3D